MPRRILRIGLMLLISFCFLAETPSGIAWGAKKPAAAKSSATKPKASKPTATKQSATKSSSVVDVVTRKTGLPLRGHILDRDHNGTILMLVSRAWLEQADPQEFAEQTEKQQAEQTQVWTDVKRRIESELTDHGAEQRLAFFLKQEMKRIENNLEHPELVTPEFFWFELPANQVTKVARADPDAKRAAVFGWHEGWTDVETQTNSTLKKKLTDARVKLDGPVPDLSDKLPVRMQSDTEWSARMAIVDYTHHAALDFQGMGETFLRTGDGQKVDVMALLPKLLSEQVGTLLGDLTNSGVAPTKNLTLNLAMLKSSIAIAEKESRRGFRVTRLDMNAERRTVAVETSFVGKLSSGEWKILWTKTETADGTKARPEDEARIAEDPQVKSVLKSLSNFGLSADVNQAIRFGAATMSAQQTADAAFFEFRERYVQRLDGPPLVLPP